MINLKTYEFLNNFDFNKYSVDLLGSDKKSITKVFEYLVKQDMDKPLIKAIINHIATYSRDNINIPLFLCLLSVSLGYMPEYNLDLVLSTVKNVHDIYCNSAPKIDFDEFAHLKEDEMLWRVFVINGKVIPRLFNDTDFNYINDLKFSCAVNLQNNEYQAFVNNIYENDNDQLVMFNIYKGLRMNISKVNRIYWDIIFGINYLLTLDKYDVDVNKIYSGTSKARLENERDYIQLDIFNYKDFDKTDNKYKVFQINNCYNNLDIPKLDENKLISFYRSLVENKDFVFLPKYKEHNNYNYKD